MFRRLALVTAGALCFAVLTAVPAVAQTGPGYATGPTCTVSSTSVTVGQTITLTCTGFAPTETITITFNSDPINVGTTTDSSSGTFSTPITIPNVAPGTHTITATGSTGDSASVTVTVVTPAAAAVTPPSVSPSAPPSGLAFTGVEIGLMALAGAVLLIVGGMLVLTTRKRRAASAS